MSEYIEKFSTLVDQLSAYESVTDPLYFTTRFADGLREDVRAVVMLQQPPDLDTACSLALLQEVSEPLKRKEFRRVDSNPWNKPPPKNPLPLPLPPATDKSTPGITTEDRRLGATFRSTEDKMATLRAYRRARGLCDKCVEKWHRGHTCAATVQLQAIQEVWELFSGEDKEGSIAESVVEPEEHVLSAISAAATTGGKTARAMQLEGVMQHQVISFLIDSGSTSSFISQKLVSRLALPLEDTTPIHVKVANGNTMTSHTYVKQAQWLIQDCDFQMDLRVLPLAIYEMILGMDWLEQFSPMEVHWCHKWMLIPYQGESVSLQGVSHNQEQQFLIQVSAVSTDSQTPSSYELLDSIKAIIHQFDDVFSAPLALPPKRMCDHNIPLIPGSRPVNIRPYRYPHY